MREVIDFNAGWLFEGSDPVDLPHTTVELPFNYFDETIYQRAFTYEKRFTGDPGWKGREVALCFEGAMADTKVRLNGEELGGHRDGYTPFEIRLTDHLRPGENHLEVTLDGTENPEIPPFGGMIDYLTYAGIYREVALKLTDPVAIASVKIETPDVLAPEKKITAAVEIANAAGGPVSGRLTAFLRDAGGNEKGRTEVAPDGDRAELAIDGLTGIALWSVDNPALYTLVLELDTEQGTDRLETRFGFREVRFTTDGFFLNGTPLKLRGLNRHQSFPYAGYAMGRTAQRRDAEILKNEIRLNMVRTSHYPQSRHFLDRCDELGLLVFTEIPGWQHIGGEVWQAESVANVKRMIRRDWNHPSVMLWGVRINESADCSAFYQETNRVAREMDTTRQTAGVRCITDSELLEDVYTMNDFILGNEELGGNRPRTPLRPQREVTGLDREVPYLVTEYGGHMFPTKSHDQEQRQHEHVLRHLEVLNAAYGDPQVAGAVGWCAFDYNTHKDFGSGDRVCYHGVMDMFREPKFAAHAYASQGDPEGGVVLEPVTFWTRGERNIGGVLPLMILTNCDAVELRFGDNPPKIVEPDRERFPHLPHPPVIVDDRHVTEKDLGEWGWVWQDGTITGLIDSKAVATRHFAAAPVPDRLEVAPDADVIAKGDWVRVAVRALDQAGNRLPHLAEPVALTVEGPATLTGPAIVPLRGGVTAFWLRHAGRGAVKATVSHPRFGPVDVWLNAE